MYHVEHLFMVEIRLVVLKLKMSQFTDVAEKEIQEPMAGQVMTMEPELSLCVFVESCSHLTNIQNFWLPSNLYSCNSWTVGNGF